MKSRKFTGARIAFVQKAAQDATSVTEVREGL